MQLPEGLEDSPFNKLILQEIEKKSGPSREVVN